MSTLPPYRPAWFVPGRHFRTLWGKLIRRRPTVPTEIERWVTPDDDLLFIHRVRGSPGAPLLILLHGLEGSPNSHYARGALARAHAAGWSAAALVFRTCGGEMNRTRRFYHSGETSDLDFAVQRLASEMPRTPIVLAGFSLGGNVLLKWLGERKSDVPDAVVAAATVSVPYDLARGSRYINRGFSRVYERHFLRSLVRKAAQKRGRFPDIAPDIDLARLRTMWDFDNAVTAPVHGFRDAEDYYTRSSSLGWLEGIRIPTLLLSALDDPFLPPDVLDEVRDAAKDNPALHCEFFERGGHVGFIGGALPWRPLYWAEWRVVDFLSAHVPRAEAGPPAAMPAAQRG
ncbi:MAG: YheT family hydrolase [Gemmatimonadaceae bacterium]